MIQSVLYVPPALDLSWLSPLAAAAQAHGWQARTYTQDWVELVWLVTEGGYDIGFTVSHYDLPPDRVPRLVTLDELPPPATTWERPRRLH